MYSTPYPNLLIASTNFSAIETSENSPQREDLFLSAHSIVLIIIYALIFICGVIGNIIIISFFSRKSKKTLYDLYITHLAIADLLAASFTPPRAIISMIIGKDGHYLTEVGCKFVSAIEPVVVNASSWILTSIALERYRGIVQPLKRRYGRMRIQTTVIIIWVMSSIVYIPYINSTTVRNKQCLPLWGSPREELAFNIAILCIQSLIPLGIMCYTIIRVTESIKERQLVCGNSKQRCATEATLLQILKVAFTLFLVCTLPYNTFYIALVIDLGINKSLHKLPLYKTVNDWLAILVIFSTVTNCFVYARLHRGFKNFSKNCGRKRQNANHSSRKYFTMMTERQSRSPKISKAGAQKYANTAV